MYPGTMNILVVVEEASLRERIEHLLLDEGFLVTAVADGFSAIRAARRRGFALVVAHARLPGAIDGATTLRHIRACQPHVKALRIGGMADRPVSWSPESDDFIAAPFRTRDLLGGVFELLERKTARGQRAG